MTKQYTPPPTVADFMYDDARVQLLLGPIGGGKTTGVLMKILKIAHEQVADENGFRRTRWACVRNTRPQLRDSVLKSVFDWFPPDGRRVIWKETDMSLTFDLPQDDHTRVQCEILFRALDDERDARRLLSVEYTGVWFSEFREIPYQLHRDALSRCGRFPKKDNGGCTWFGLLGESNMPTKGSDWHMFMEVTRPDHCRVYKQPSAMSDKAENRENLPPDYYETLIAGATPGWIQAYVTCEYPDSLDGKSVYAQTFNTSRHVSDKELKPSGQGMSAATLVVGVDQGRNPCAVIGQMQPNGRLHIIDEVIGANMGMETFADTKLVPLLASKYPGYTILVVIDPAGFNKNEVDDRTPADVLMSHGLKVIPAPTNDPDRRISAVEQKLMLHDGLLISSTCRVLIEGMANSYKFKTKKDGQLEDRPEKLHPWSDVNDALQYLCLVVGGHALGRILRKTFGGNRPTQQMPSPKAWT
jgi:hypothetical protein